MTWYEATAADSIALCRSLLDEHTLASFDDVLRSHGFDKLARSEAMKPTQTNHKEAIVELEWLKTLLENVIERAVRLKIPFKKRQPVTDDMAAAENGRMSNARNIKDGGIVTVVEQEPTAFNWRERMAERSQQREQAEKADIRRKQSHRKAQQDQAMLAEAARQSAGAATATTNTNTTTTGENSTPPSSASSGTNATTSENSNPPSSASTASTASTGPTGTMNKSIPNSEGPKPSPTEKRQTNPPQPLPQSTPSEESSASHIPKPRRGRRPSAQNSNLKRSRESLVEPSAEGSSAVKRGAATGSTLRKSAGRRSSVKGSPASASSMPDVKKQKVQKQKVQKQMVQKPPEDVWCICRGPSAGLMLACDNNKCPYEWFHASCVGLAHVPEKWFCPICRPHQRSLERSNRASSRRRRH